MRNFTEIGSVPGTLAGDIGATDHRQASVEVDVRRISETEVRVQPRITFTVRDIVDFCPGDCGSGAERDYTVPMSRWEATGIAGDVPFRVVYTMELDPFTMPYVALPMSNERLISEIMQRYVYIVQESRRAGGNIEDLATLAGEIGRFVQTYIANVMRESGIERPAARERLREEILNDGRTNPDGVENIFRFAEVSGASSTRSTGGRRER